ncbi:MAG: hypothetical protein R8G66_15270 [Cytophagales bacterium]|nr:hypothetical protein [Cytophagales bacterium]
MKLTLFLSLLNCSGFLFGQGNQTEVRIHAVYGLSSEEVQMNSFIVSLPPLITEIINSDYFQHAVLNTPMEFKRPYLREEMTNKEILSSLLEAHEERFDIHCRSAGMEELDMIDTEDHVMDIVLEFMPAEEMKARNWSTMTAGFTPLGCPYIRVSKHHFNRYLDNNDSVAASRMIIHEYMHTLYFNHETQEINRKDVPYAVEGIARETARWLRFSKEQPEATGSWKWVYSVKNGQLISADDTDGSYEIELTEEGQIRFGHNGKVIKEEIAKAYYFSPNGQSYGFWNYLETTERNGVELVFDGNKLRTDYFPEAYGVYNFFEKVE